MLAPPRRVVVPALVATVAIEALTCALRFGLHHRSARSTAWAARFTLGWRIHHGYLGLLILLAAVFPRRGRARDVLIVLGVALAASDLIHHFVVLWWMTGSPEFDLFYKD